MRGGGGGRGALEGEPGGGGGWRAVDRAPATALTGGWDSGCGARAGGEGAVGGSWWKGTHPPPSRQMPGRALGRAPMGPPPAPVPASLPQRSDTARSPTRGGGGCHATPGALGATSAHTRWPGGRWAGARRSLLWGERCLYRCCSGLSTCENQTPVACLPSAPHHYLGPGGGGGGRGVPSRPSECASGSFPWGGGGGGCSTPDSPGTNTYAYGAGGAGAKARGKGSRGPCSRPAPLCSRATARAVRTSGPPEGAGDRRRIMPCNALSGAGLWGLGGTPKGGGEGVPLWKARGAAFGAPGEGVGRLGGRAGAVAASP